MAAPPQGDGADSADSADSPDSGDGAVPTPAETAAAGEEDEAPPRTREEGEEAQEEAPAASRRDPADPYEEENRDYFFMDFFYRQLVVPEFIQQVFLDEGVTGTPPGFGMDLTYRKNGFNIVISGWYLGVGGPFSVTGNFREQGEPRSTTEEINVNIHAAFLTAAFMWSVNFTDWLALEIGLDVGFGLLFGNLTRTEAYESSPGQGDWRACPGPGDPAAPISPDNPSPTYCEQTGGHYNSVEGTWVDGPPDARDIPFLFPWIALPHIALRFKPVHFLQVRAEVGYNIWGFFFGGSLGVGF